MLVAGRMTATAKNVGRLRFAFAVSAAILAAGLSGALTTGMRALGGLVHNVLSNVDLQDGIGMLVTPSPVIRLIFSLQARKVIVLAMIFFHPNAIRAVFVRIPVMFVVELLVFINAVVSLQRDRGNNDGAKQGRAEQNRIQETHG